MLTLCTLFDHNYLDKGLAMYESLEKVCDDFELYVLAMSDKCYEILTDLNYPHIKPIKLIDFEDEELLRVKPTRKVGEYCWTCSSSLIRYVLMTYKPEYCTYIDADMCFYSDPQVLIDEMKVKNASVLVVGHRFCKSERKLREWVSGKYCVEFNAFKNDKNGMKLVNIWRRQCLECCSAADDGVHWGDQKYLDNWCEDYSYCIETEHLGAGVAPWNFSQYKFIKKLPDDKIIVECRKKNWPLIFYHFENVQYIEKKIVRINLYPDNRRVDDELVDALYPSYLRLVDEKKNMLKKQFGLDVLILKHPGFEKKRRGLIKRIPNLVNPMKLRSFIRTKIRDLFFQNSKDIVHI